MTVTQGHREVQDLLHTFLDFSQDPVSGLYSAWIDPAALLGFEPYPLPPGQIVSVGSTVNGGYYIDYDGYLHPNEGMFDKNAPHDQEKWAVVPHFHTRESAEKMAMYWINQQRPDLVKACIREATEALAYRARAARTETARAERQS
ncbi:hypothetical protein [Pseudomonas gingeri]